MKIKIVSRPSNLALKQVEEVKECFLSEHDIEVIRVMSLGDKQKDVSMLENIADDFFTRELDEIVLRGEADIAVHSAKDVPSNPQEGLEIVMMMKGDDSSDSLVSRNNVMLEDLPFGSKVGTSSLLRKKQLLEIRNDLEIVSIRGTIEERLAYVDSNEVEAIVVATCALKRLGLQHKITQRLPFETHPLQGSLAVVARKDNEKIKEIYYRSV